MQTLKSSLIAIFTAFLDAAFLPFPLFTSILVLVMIIWAHIAMAHSDEEFHPEDSLGLIFTSLSGILLMWMFGTFYHLHWPEASKASLVAVYAPIDLGILIVFAWRMKRYHAWPDWLDIAWDAVITFLIEQLPEGIRKRFQKKRKELRPEDDSQVLSDNDKGDDSQ